MRSIAMAVVSGSLIIAGAIIFTAGSRAEPFGVLVGHDGIAIGFLAYSGARWVDRRAPADTASRPWRAAVARRRPGRGRAE